jgi:tetrahydromethanopterin S-methyltransferase subunit A
VAVCTLTDEALADAVADQAPPEVAIVGSLHTENLGIERIIRNTLADPNIRYLVLAGADSKQAIGHLPGQTLKALSTNGVDEKGRIVGAMGRRPVLRNLPEGAVEHFRRTVEVIDRIGSADPDALIADVRRLGESARGPAEAFDAGVTPSVVQGYVPERMTSDPAGYFVAYVDARRRVLVLEHYGNDGVFNVAIEGRTAAEVYTPAVEKALVSRLDHAAYLGRELARAEVALATGAKFVQDGAPERAAAASPKGSCGCGPVCS